MDELLKQITELQWWAVLIVLLILLPLWIFKSPIGEMLKNINIKKKVKSRNIKDLIHHGLFTTCDDVRQKVGLLDFSEDSESPIKNYLMKKLIEIKMESVKKYFKELINIEDLDKMQPMQFHSEVSRCLNDLVDEYNKEALSDFMNRGLSKEDATYFINTYETYRETCVDGFISRLNSICNSSIFTNNFDRLLTVLEISALAMDIIVIDVQSVSYQINGRFKKYK